MALETGWSKADAERLRASERNGLAWASAVVATSATTARVLIESYGVAREHITVAYPGTDHFPAARGSDSDTISLLSVGAIIPRKGHDCLIAALATIAELRWQITIAGDQERDEKTLHRLKQDIVRLGLGGRVKLAGGVSDAGLARLYDRADLFVLASHYEGYGMAYTEALARGLPVIGTTGGAIPEAVPADAGLLVPPGDVAALAQALRWLISDEAARRRLAQGAQEAARGLPTWADAASRVARALEAVTCGYDLQQRHLPEVRAVP